MPEVISVPPYALIEFMMFLILGILSLLTVTNVSRHFPYELNSTRAIRSFSFNNSNKLNKAC